MLTILIYVIVIVVVAGAASFLLKSAPFIDEPMKGWAVWAIMAVALILIVIVVVQALGGGTGTMPRLL